MKQIDSICAVLPRCPRGVQTQSLLHAFSLTIFCKILHEATRNSDICCTLCACLVTLTDEKDRFYLCCVAEVSKGSTDTIAVASIFTKHFAENFANVKKLARAKTTDAFKPAISPALYPLTFLANCHLEF
jgi:hypothetical protein